jgi:hypothetical protein
MRNGQNKRMPGDVIAIIKAITAVVAGAAAAAEVADTITIR